MDLGWSRGEARGFAQKRSFPLIRLNEVERKPGCDTENKAGKAGARSQIDRARGVVWNVWNQLKRVFDVALPNRLLVGAADKIDPCIPSQKESCELLQSGECFT